jgi:hypothetical protein
MLLQLIMLFLQLVSLLIITSDVPGTCKLRNEMRNEKRNEIYRNETKRN